MKGRLKELIAIGASIGANCTPCLKHHVRLAKEFGVPEEEIKEAIEVALQVRKNSTQSIDKLIEETVSGNSQSDSKTCC